MKKSFPEPEKSILKPEDSFNILSHNTRRVKFNTLLEDKRIFEVEESDEELSVNRRGKRKINENDISTEYDDWDLKDIKGVVMSELYIDGIYILNHPCINVIIKRFSIPRKLLVKVLSFTFQKNIESPSHSLSTKLVSTIAKRLKKGKNKAFNEVERLLCITLKHHILTFFKTKNNAKLLLSIEDKILEILQCPLKFSIRILLVTLLIFVGGHPFTESFYKVKLDSLARQLEYNVIMLHYVPEEGNIISESIPTIEEYELRLMIINFLNYFCQDIPYFENLTWSEYSSNAFLVCFDDTIKELSKFVTSLIETYPYQTNFIDTKTIELTIIVNHMIPHLSCLYECGFFEGKMVDGVHYSVLKNIARTMVAIFDNEENKKKLTKKTFCYALKGCFLSLSIVGVLICKTAREYFYYKSFFVQLESWITIIIALYNFEYEIIEDEAKKKKIMEGKVNENRIIENEKKENETIECRTIEDKTKSNEIMETEDLEFQRTENKIIETEDLQDKTKENEYIKNSVPENQTIEIETINNETIETKAVENQTVKDEFIEEIEIDKDEIIICKIKGPEPIPESFIRSYWEELQFYRRLSLQIYKSYIESDKTDEIMMA